MNKAQEKAWDWASKNKLDPYSMGRAYAEGYEQAEKDNELTWDDIHAIAIIEDKLIHELCLNDQTLPTTQEFYEEVLKRFKAKKKNNDE